MPNLTKIRENKLKREKELKFYSENYKNPSSLKIISNVIKLNNILVMKWLAENKGLSNDQYQIMLDNFLKNISLVILKSTGFSSNSIPGSTLYFTSDFILLKLSSGFLTPISK